MTNNHKVHDHSDRNMVFLQLELGGDRNFCYLIGDRQSGEAVAIDPGFDADSFNDIAKDRGLTIKHILITHGHSDHRDQADTLVQLTDAELWAGAADEVPGASDLGDEQEFTLGESSVKALATPGHSAGHYCFLSHGKLVTGDLLFCGKIGGTGSYFPGSSPEQQFKSLARMMKLPDETLVFPGHDYFGGEGYMPHSSIGFEKSNNPFLTAQDFDAFCYLKDHWADYKKEHGVR
ncbi:MAG: MBL fold metallo-hydrolase [bacterium]|nr:MBL fold metallo-hydrolase [bacterium]